MHPHEGGGRGAATRGEGAHVTDLCSICCHRRSLATGRIQPYHSCILERAPEPEGGMEGGGGKGEGGGERRGKGVREEEEVVRTPKKEQIIISVKDKHVRCMCLNATRLTCQCC